MSSTHVFRRSEDRKTITVIFTGSPIEGQRFNWPETYPFQCREYRFQTQVPLTEFELPEKHDVQGAAEYML